jgi:ricin-type beta-trefoil lectin protein
MRATLHPLKMAAAALLFSAATLLSPAAPAMAAPPVTIQNIGTADCLDQHYDAAGQPTTTVYVWPDPCHFVGNQQWTFDFIGGSGNSYRLINARSGWCLSAPNGAGSRVFTEFCAASVPAKQKWTPVLNSFGSNLLVNALSGQCLRQSGADAYVAGCDENTTTQRWSWR